jgi:hypothetical protein
MYPESNVTTKDFITKSKIALTEYMLNDIDSPRAWHVWKPLNTESLLSQQMNMVNKARKIFDETGVPREQHNEFLKNPTIIGNDCIKAFVNKLRTRNKAWDDYLYQMIQQAMERKKPQPLSLLDVQRIVAEKIIAFDNMKTSLESAAPTQQSVGKAVDYGKASAQLAQVHAIAQQPAEQESKPYTGTIRKDRSRQRSRSIEAFDYSKPIVMARTDRRQSMGSYITHKQYEEELKTRGRSAERGRSRGRSEERSRNRYASMAKADKVDTRSIYSMSTVEPSPDRSRSRSRDRPTQPTYNDRHHDRQRRDRATK